MAKEFQNTTWARGEVVTLRVTIKTGEDPTGYAMRFTMKDGYSGVPLLEKTTADGSVTVDGSKRVLVALSYAESKALLSGNAYRDVLFDLWRTNAGADAEIARGRARIRPVVRDLP